MTTTAAPNDRELFLAERRRGIGGSDVAAVLGLDPHKTPYQLWRDNFAKPETALVAHAPTLLLNDRPAERSVVEYETKRDPDNAAREYGAKFMTTGTTFLFESHTIEAAVTPEPFALQPGDVIAAGGDFGFLSDSSALVMVARRGDVLHVYDGVEERPTEGNPLKPSVTVDVFAKKITGRCDYLMADGHYRASIEEHLQHYGLNFAPAPTIPADAYMRARMLMRELGRVVIHPLPFRDRLVQQLREVHARPTAGGRIAPGLQAPAVARAAVTLRWMTSTSWPMVSRPSLPGRFSSKLKPKASSRSIATSAMSRWLSVMSGTRRWPS